MVKAYVCLIPCDQAKPEEKYEFDSDEEHCDLCLAHTSNELKDYACCCKHAKIYFDKMRAERAH